VDDTLTRLASVIDARKSSDASSSYVASLFAKGIDQILKKIGEEASETIIAGKGGEQSEIIHETADLWFHTLVMLAYYELGPEAILSELEQRFGTSGIEEKASRQ